MSERKLLGEGLSLEERIQLAQLVQQPGWKILVKIMAEACRDATEAVIKLKPTTERYSEVLAGLQTVAHAMNKFSADVLDSVKIRQREAVMETQAQEKKQFGQEPPPVTRFTGFRAPQLKVKPESPTEGAQ